jgi:hypothetical protein
MTTPDPAAPTTEKETRYILITECLQNDFFLNPECRLFLQDGSVRPMLVAKGDHDAYDPDLAPRQVAPELLARGPLGLFLQAIMGKRFAGGDEGLLHVINIRDWHTPDDSYDAERRAFGRHCLAGSWGARYIEGLEQYLDPAAPGEDGKASFAEQGKARIYHIHADSVFDFRPRWDEREKGAQAKFHPSELERLLDVLVTGKSADIEELASVLKGETGERSKSQALNTLARNAAGRNAAADSTQIYVAVIGVYTDIKVQLILSGLRSRYELPNLAVSDTLTGSKSLERHLHGLDFADKLLNVEVIHGIGDLACFLGSEPPLQDESKIVGAENYSQYRSFFVDKQSVLAYESEKLQEYAQLTGKRAIAVYDTIKRANAFLLVWGSAFLTLSLVGTILNFISPHRWSWEITAATGGIGLLQLVAAFFSKPMRDLQSNLNNLASLRMILENHSLKTAFTRFHLTTPEVLRELKEPREVERASAQISTLASQLEVIDRFQASDYWALANVIGFSSDKTAANGSAAATNGQAATNGSSDASVGSDANVVTADADANASAGGQGTDPTAVLDPAASTDPATAP